MSDPVADLLGGGGARVFKFPSVGTEIIGYIVKAQVTDQRDLQGNVKTFANGDPMQQIVVTVQTDIREDADDDGKRRVFVKGAMFSALREALEASGAPTLEVNGRITVTHTSVGTPSQKGYNPPKLFAIVYEPSGGAPAASAPAPADAVASAVQGYGYDEEPF